MSIQDLDIFSEHKIQDVMLAISKSDRDLQRKIPEHLNDMLGQLIDRHILDNDLWHENRSLRSGSWSSKARAFRNAHLVQEQKLLQKYEQLYKKVRYEMGSEEQMRNFLIHVETVIEHFNFSERTVRSYAPDGVQVVNAVSVDTNRGYKIIQLCHANVVDIKSDILVLTAQNTPDTKPSGFIISKLKHISQFTSAFKKNLLQFSDTEWTNIQDGNQHTKFQYLLTLRVGGPIDSEPLVSYMNRIINGLFASIASLEFLGTQVHSITMPVLQAHRVREKEDYKSIVDNLIQQSVRWIKTSESTNLINLCVYYGDEIKIWNDALNEILGRTVVQIEQNNAIDSLRKKLLLQCRFHKNGPLQSGIQPLIDILSNQMQIGIEHVAVYGRKLVEAICKEVLIQHGQRIDGDLMSCIERLRKGGIAAPWIISYMHNLRIFGNEEVHIRKEGKVYTPNSLNDNDFISQLSAIQAILLYWEEIRSNEIGS